MNPISRFGVPHMSKTRNITHLSSTPMEIGFGVDIVNEEVLPSSGHKTYGIVVQCTKIDDAKYLLTICTQSEGIAVHLSDTVDSRSKDPMGFIKGKLSPDNRGIYKLQSVEENTFTVSGKPVRSGIIQLP